MQRDVLRRCSVTTLSLLGILVSGVATGGQAGHAPSQALGAGWQGHGQYTAQASVGWPHAVEVAANPESPKTVPGEKQAGSDDC
jgi:hypothetical protein